MEEDRVIHPFPPLIDQETTILILGSFPSVKSREQLFYYGHKQNRFWKVIASLYSEEVPTTIEDKKQLLYKHHIGLWDVIKECTIKGSSDSSIKDVIPNDIEQLIRDYPIKHIYCNGKLSYNLFNKYIHVDIPVTSLPSTSPANAAYSIDKLLEYWKDIKTS